MILALGIALWVLAAAAVALFVRHTRREQHREDRHRNSDSRGSVVTR